MSTTPEPDPLSKNNLRRHKKRQEQRQKQDPILLRYRLEFGLLFCLVTGTFFLLNPFAQWIPDTPENAATLTNMADWLAHRGGSQIVGGTFLLLAFPLILLTLRKGILYNQRLWRRNGCPGCGRDELRRTSRIWLDRIGHSSIGAKPCRRQLPVAEATSDNR